VVRLILRDVAQGVAHHDLVDRAARALWEDGQDDRLRARGQALRHTAQVARVALEGVADGNLAVRVLRTQDQRAYFLQRLRACTWRCGGSRRRHLREGAFRHLQFARADQVLVVPGGLDADLRVAQVRVRLPQFV